MGQDSDTPARKIRHHFVKKTGSAFTMGLRNIPFDPEYNVNKAEDRVYESEY